jgi:hypothetical protein
VRSGKEPGEKHTPRGGYGAPRMAQKGLRSGEVGFGKVRCGEVRRGLVRSGHSEPAQGGGQPDCSPSGFTTENG